MPRRSPRQERTQPPSKNSFRLRRSYGGQVEQTSWWSSMWGLRDSVVSLWLAAARLRDITGRTRQSFFPSAPAGVHSVGGALQYGFDLADLSLLDSEHLRELPRPRVGRTAGNRAAVRRLECAVSPEGVVEEGEAEDQAAFSIDGDIPSIVDAPYEMD